MKVRMPGRVLVFGVSAILLFSACTDGDAPVEPGAAGLPFGFVPSYSSLAAASALPVHRIRLLATDAETGQLFDSMVVEVDPTDDSWDVSFELARVAEVRSATITILLLNVVGDVEQVQWSGRIGPIALSGSGIRTSSVPFYRGSPGNLTVTAVRILQPPAALLEGETAAFAAEVSGATGEPEVFWLSLDETIATVQDDGEVRALLPGMARIVATSGPRADTTTLQVRGRVAQLQLDPTTLQLGSIGSPFAIEATARDARGAVLADAEVGWTVDEEGVIEHLGGGVFLTLANGEVEVTASSVEFPDVQAVATVTVDQQAVIMTILSGDGQVAEAGSAVADPLRVQVTDESGAPVAGVEVVFAVASGGGSLDGTTTVETEPNGIATFSGVWTLGSEGSHTVTASTGGVTSVTFQATATAAERTGLRTWTSESGGAWSDGANWSDGLAPAAGDSVRIVLAGSYTVTLDTDASVALLELGGGGEGAGTRTLTGTGVTLAVDESLTVEDGGALSLTSASVTGSGSITNLASMSLRGTSVDVAVVNEGTLTIPPGTTSFTQPLLHRMGGGGEPPVLRLVGDNGGAFLVLPGGFTNEGIIELEGGFASSLTLLDGVLVNDGILRTAGSGAHALNLALDNRGGFLAAATTTALGRAGAAHLNTGGVDVTDGSLVLNLGGAGSGFTTSGGTMAVGAGRSLTVNGGTFVFGGGNLSGEGNVLFRDGAAAQLTSSFQSNALTFGVEFSAVTGAGTFTNTGGMALQEATIAVPLTNEGTLTVHPGVTSLADTFQHREGGGGPPLLHLAGTNGGAQLLIADGFVNEGTIELSGGFPNTLTLEEGTLVNDGVLRVTGTAAQVLLLELDNRGSLELQGGTTTLGRDGAVQVNTGVIDVAGGNLVLFQPAEASFATTSGTVTIGAGSTMTVDRGTFTFGGENVSGAGALVVQGEAAVELTSDFHTGLLALTLASATLSGDATFVNTGSAVFGGATVTLPVVNEGTLTVTPGTTQLSAGFVHRVGESEADPVLTISGSNGAANMLVTGGFVNEGLVEVTGGFSSSLSVSAGSLVNEGTLRATGTNHVLTIALDNRGAFEIDNAGVSINRASVSHQNTGTIAVNTGNLSFLQGGFGPPGFTTSGSISLAAGRMLTVSGGTFWSDGGLVTGEGQLRLVNATVVGTEFVSRGRVALSNTSVQPPAVNHGELTLESGTNTFFTTLHTEPEGLLPGSVLLTATNGAAVLNAEEMTVGTGGLFEVSGGFAATAATGSLVNDGTVRTVGTTLMTLGFELDNRATFEVVGSGNVLLGPAATHLNSGFFDVDGGNLEILEDPDSTFFQNSGTVRIGAGRTVVLDAGRFWLNGGTLEGTGTLRLTDAELMGTAPFTNEGTLDLQQARVTVPTTNQGVIRALAGMSEISQPLENLAGALVEVAATGGAVSLVGYQEWLNRGEILIGGGFQGSLHMAEVLLTNEGTIRTAGSGEKVIESTIRNDGEMVFQGGTTRWHGDYAGTSENNGLIQLAGGNLDLEPVTEAFQSNGEVWLGGGRLSIANAFFFAGETGSTGGAGEFDLVNATFANSGTLNPALREMPIFTGSGDFHTDGTVRLGIGGLLAGIEYDQLNVEGSVMLEGTLEVVLLDDFQPAVGDTFTLIQSMQGSLSMNFGQVVLPELDGPAFLSLTYGPSSVTVTVVE